MYATPEEAMKEGKRREEVERRRRQMKYGINPKLQQQPVPVNPSIHHAPSSYSLDSSYQKQSQLPQQRTMMSGYEHGAGPGLQRSQPRVPSYEQPPAPSRVMAQMPAHNGSSASMSTYAPPQQVYYQSQTAGHPVATVPHSSPQNISIRAPNPPPPRSMQSSSAPQVQYRKNQPLAASSAGSIASQESQQEQQDNLIATELFNNHDLKNMGRLTADELHNLLQNDDGSKFCTSSIESLINLFGGSRFGTVNLNEFISLYKRVKKWRKCFVDNDINGSFTLTMAEFHKAVQSLGYLIPFEVSEKLFECYAEYFDQQRLNKEMKFDRFVETLVWLMRLTKVFRKYDLQQEGTATIAYKDFIDLTLYLGKFLPH